MRHQKLSLGLSFVIQKEQEVRLVRKYEHTRLLKGEKTKGQFSYSLNTGDEGEEEEALLPSSEYITKITRCVDLFREDFSPNESYM